MPVNSGLQQRGTLRLSSPDEGVVVQRHEGALRPEGVALPLPAAEERGRGTPFLGDIVTKTVVNKSLVTESLVTELQQIELQSV